MIGYVWRRCLGTAVWALDIWAPGFFLASSFCSYVVSVPSSLRSRQDRGLQSKHVRAQRHSRNCLLHCFFFITGKNKIVKRRPNVRRPVVWRPIGGAQTAAPKWTSPVLSCYRKEYYYHVTFYEFSNCEHQYNIFDINKFDLFLHNKLYVTHGIIEADHSLITL